MITHWEYTKDTGQGLNLTCDDSIFILSVLSSLVEKDRAKHTTNNGGFVLQRGGGGGGGGERQILNCFSLCFFPRLTVLF